MKLRLKNDSVRFRVVPSEVNMLLREGKLNAQVRFSCQPNGWLLYSLILDQTVEKVTVDFIDGEVRARLPREEAVRWATTEAVTLRGEKELDGSSFLTLLVEKDFACLDLSDEENLDTYPNPNAGQVC
jgi:hypothetical protein